MHNRLKEILLVSHNVSGGKPTGISRYTQELYEHLNTVLPVKTASFKHLPLSSRFESLKLFPIGIEDHKHRSIQHFMQIQGCSIQLYRPFRRAMATVHDIGLKILPVEYDSFSKFDRQLLMAQFRGLRKMAYIVADSDFTRQAVQDVLGYPADRLFTVHIGINEQFQPTRRNSELIEQIYQIEKQKDQLDILYVGNEQPRKNISILLEAIYIIKQRGYAVRLIKIGSDAKYRPTTLSKIEQLQLEGQVHFVGFVPDEHLAYFYNFADIFMTTSLLEGFGLPVAEAMACGTPVVCSDRGSLPEIAGEAAVICAAEDASAFADAVLRVWEDGTFKNDLIERGLKQASKFTWQNTIQQLLPVYQRLSGE